MHSESKQNKNSTYFLCLAHNYSTGPGPGGHEYNLQPRGYRLSKQQASKFCANSHVARYMHDWGYTRECLEDRLNSPALESILLLLVQVPSSIYSPCPAFGRHLNTRQRYLWPNKGWHPQLGIRSQLFQLFKLLLKPSCSCQWRGCGQTEVWAVSESSEKSVPGRSPCRSDLCCRAMDSGISARTTILNGWTDMSCSEI